MRFAYLRPGTVRPQILTGDFSRAGFVRDAAERDAMSVEGRHTYMEVGGSGGGKLFERPQGGILRGGAQIRECSACLQITQHSPRRRPCRR
jgi:hypothetical protein